VVKCFSISNLNAGNACLIESSGSMSTPHRAQSANQYLSLSHNGRNHLMRREGVVAHYYNDDANNCTYGVGTLAHLGPCTPAELQTPVSNQDVVTNLNQGIDVAANAVRQSVTNRHLTREQFDALVSFTYNVGAGGARNVLRQVNDGDLDRAVHTMQQFTHATVRGPNGQPQRDANGHIITRVLPGLVHRRHEESIPFRGQRRP
jgi:lysozyme